MLLPGLFIPYFYIEEVVELESGEVRARFAATPDNPVVGYFTLATYRDDGKLKGINVRRH